MATQKAEKTRELIGAIHSSHNQLYRSTLKKLKFSIQTKKNPMLQSA